MVVVNSLGKNGAGVRLKEWRKESGLTKRKLAKKLGDGFSKKKIKKAEKGTASDAFYDKFMRAAVPVLSHHAPKASRRRKREMIFAGKAREALDSLNRQ
jgi:transcriptional regulator with XRE-family HTH domain